MEESNILQLGWLLFVLSEKLQRSTEDEDVTMFHFSIFLAALCWNGRGMVFQMVDLIYNISEWSCRIPASFQWAAINMRSLLWPTVCGHMKHKTQMTHGQQTAIN